MRARAWVAIAAAGCAAALACAARAPKYPACQRDDQCAVGNRHDYCVGGRCAYCRTALDCGDRQRCRGGACEADPDAPPLPEAGVDAGEDEETGEEPAGEGEAQEPVDPQQRRLQELEKRVERLRQQIRGRPGRTVH